MSKKKAGSDQSKKMIKWDILGNQDKGKQGMPKGERPKKGRLIIATKHNKTTQKLQGRGEAEAAQSNTFSRLSKNAGVKQSKGQAALNSLLWASGELGSKRTENN